MGDFVRFSKEAVENIQALLKEENNPALKMRLFIVGGSCAGLQFAFQLDEIFNDDDTTVDQINSFSVIADPISVQYLEGVIIDYKEESEGFSIHNPNIQTGCPGCGGPL